MPWSTSTSGWAVPSWTTPIPSGGTGCPISLVLPTSRLPWRIRRRFEASSGRRTDQQYKAAVEQLAKVKANVRVKVEEEDQAGDFSAEPAQEWLEEPLPLDFDRSPWEEKLRRYTAPFSAYGHIYSANATLSANVETRWYVNSEGSEIRTSQSYYRLMIMAYTKAEDGMELPRYESFFSFTPEGLPDDSRILQTVEEMIADLEALREAPLVDPYHRTRHPLRPGQRGVLP